MGRLHGPAEYLPAQLRSDVRTTAEVVIEPVDEPVLHEYEVLEDIGPNDGERAFCEDQPVRIAYYANVSFGIDGGAMAASDVE